MKKFWIVVAALLIVSVGIGKYYCTTYTDYDLNDEITLNAARVTNYFDEGEFQRVALDMATGEVIDPLILDEFEGEVEILDLSNMIRDDLNSAKIVAVAKCTGGIRNLSGTCEQNVVVDRVLKGDDKLAGQQIKVYSDNFFHFDIENKEAWICNSTNFMQEGEEYLIFIDSTNNKDVYCTKYLYDVGYFVLEEMENVIIKDKNNLFYEEVREAEFFVRDEVALAQLMEIKEEMLEKYLGE